MPPSQALKASIIDVFVRWVMAGMPNTAADAALIPTPTPVPTAMPTPNSLLKHGTIESGRIVPIFYF